jgi:hypothetical protein
VSRTEQGPRRETGAQEAVDQTEASIPHCACRIRECDAPDPATCAVHGELHTMICLDPGWRERARARAAAADARRQAAKELRAELKAARDAGKAARHARRLGRR